MVETLKAHGETFGSTEAFAKALKYFERIKESPGQFMQLALAGMLEIVQGVMLGALDIAKKIIDLLIDGINAALESFLKLLDSEWKIPFLSDLYKSIAGGPLTALDLVALIGALSLFTSVTQWFGWVFSIPWADGGSTGV